MDELGVADGSLVLTETIFLRWVAYQQEQTCPGTGLLRL